MRKIDYFELKLGDLVLFENLPSSRSMINSCLVCGILAELNSHRFMLANTTAYNGDLSDYIYYSPERIKNDCLYQARDNFKVNDFSPGQTCLSKGDLVLVRHGSDLNLEAYLGFVNRLNHDQILVRNYLANLWEPPLANKNDLLISLDSEKEYSYLVLEPAIRLAKHFDFNLSYGIEKPN